MSLKELALPELINHILAEYHRPLDDELPRLEALAREVADAHPDNATLADVRTVYASLRGELEDHMAKEEQILFPMIGRGQGAMADGPIAVMHQEHDSATAALESLRELTGGYQAPADACHQWQALWAGLGKLETSLLEHIRIENDILFPGALSQD